MRRRLLLLAIPLWIATAHADAPAWYERKKKVEQEKKQEAATKAAEKPAIGPGSSAPGVPQISTLSQPEGPPAGTNLLFKKGGLNESLSLEFGQLKQPVITGRASTLSYTMSWWWTPRLTFGPTVKATGIFDLTYAYMFVQLGPQARWFMSRRWNLTGFTLFGVSRGLSRVEQSHIPGPPDTVALRARKGLAIGAELTHLFWVSRNFSFGPTLGFWKGKQGERTWSMMTIGITYQSGRPEYGGSVIDDWRKY